MDLGTWSTTTDVDNFFTTYNHANNYGDLALGNYVTIMDGTYNAQWMIAAFDYYKWRGLAGSDIVNNDNGYGIVFLPRNGALLSTSYHDTNTTAGGYANTKMALETLPAIATNLKTILGTHLIPRYCAISISAEQNNGSVVDGILDLDVPEYNSQNLLIKRQHIQYDLTLMSEPQLYGTIVQGIICDPADAHNKLPLFNYIGLHTYRKKNGSGSFGCWLSGIVDTMRFCYCSDSDDASNYTASKVCGVRPLMYLR